MSNNYSLTLLMIDYKILVDSEDYSFKWFVFCAYSLVRTVKTVCLSLLTVDDHFCKVEIW